jgi:aryl-alcohol dehydrogenase-like predicted oxidoreductase
MDTIKLKHTNLTVSRICFGSMTFGGQTDEATAKRMVDRCLDGGINFFDTANVYNTGESEIILGNALRAHRHQVILATKVQGKMGDAPDESGLSRAAMLKAIDDSLRRLGTDYLDIYYMHQPDYSVPLEETLETMDQLVRQGKVRYPGSSNYSGWQVCRMLWIAENIGYKPAWLSQPMYNLLARGIEEEYLPMAEEFGVSTVVYNPLAGGLLTGKHERAGPMAGTRFDNNQLYLERYWRPAYFDAVDKLREIAGRAGRSLVSLSLNWLLRHTPVDCVILGASHLEQLGENLKAVEDALLTKDVVAACDSVWATLRGVTPRYNR